MGRVINEIILHCTATREGVDVSAAMVDKWHKQRGWNGIGYHYLIRLNGDVEKGRADDVVGAHCKHHNSHSLGVAYVGGVDGNGKPKDTRTEKQRETLLALVTELLEQYPTINKISPHYAYDNKACPSFNVDEWLDDVGLSDYKGGK